MSPLLIFNAPDFFPPDDSSIYHFSILLTNPFCIFTAAGFISYAFLQSIHSIPIPNSLHLQLLKIILSINGPLSPLIFFSTHFVHLLLQMVIQFIIKYSRDIDLTFVTSFSFSLFFMISTVLLMMTQSIAQAFFHDKMKMNLSSVYLMLVIISCLLLPLILSLVFPNHCTLLCIAGWSPIPFQNLTFS